MTKSVFAYIGLGSNLDSPATQLQNALDALAAHKAIESVQCSPWYQSRAVGPGEQPDYINAVAKITTSLAPEHLLTALQTIENTQGRTREIRWGARTLDLDLLLYDEIIMQTDRLTIPHPQMYNRDFVLKPLADLAPTLSLPSGEPIEQLLANCDCSDLMPIAWLPIAFYLV